MTTQRDFKYRVRERMAKTGERYAAARAQILHPAPFSVAATNTPPAPAPAIKGLLAGYTTFGGINGDTGAVCNALRQAGIRSTHDGKPLSEALINGLCGGVGFLYAVFEYGGMPPMLSVMMRHDTMSDSFIQGGLKRLGVEMSVSGTSSPSAARKALDAALAAGKPALCVTDLAGAAYCGMPAMMSGMAPTVVSVAGHDGDDVLLDDRAPEPRRVSMAQFARQRASYKKGKHRLITIDGPKKGYDLGNAVREAIRATARRYFESPYKGFASNFGFAGMGKWRKLLTDAKDKKAWPALFTQGAAAYLGLRRVYDGIEHEYTAPAGGRALYADFLTEAAAITKQSGLLNAAESYRRAGEQWRAISQLVASCGDKEVERGCALSDRRSELLDSVDGAVSKQLEEAWQERMAVAKSCTLSREAAAALYGQIAGMLGNVMQMERTAVAELERASA